MGTRDWINVPIGLDATRWVTVVGLRTVLVVAHSMTSLQRLLDIMPLFETDFRIQAVFTQGPGAFSSGVDHLMENLGCMVVPWEQAINVSFDLALASGFTGLHQLHAPIIVFPHGASHNKFVPVKRSDTSAIRAVYGLNSQQLIRDGNVVPSVIALSHNGDLQILREQCPEALSSSAVVGDPCLDRILISRSRRDTYRNALGLMEHDRLLVISSTWGPHSVLGTEAEVFGRAMTDAREHSFSVATLLHPNVWTGHGRRQVRQWFRHHVDCGMLLVEPEEEWRAMLTSADWVIGDHGSACIYAAAAGCPVLHTNVASSQIVPGSAMDLAHGLTPLLRPDLPIYQQLVEASAAFEESTRGQIVDRMTSAPGNAAARIRRIIYDYLRLEEPPRPAQFREVPAVRRGTHLFQ